MSRFNVYAIISAPGCEVILTPFVVEAYCTGSACEAGGVVVEPIALGMQEDGCDVLVRLRAERA